MSAMDKKVKTLLEALPRLDESEARRLLERAGGSVNKASEMALEGGEWSSSVKQKKIVKKEDKKVEVAAPRRDDRPRREFVERKPRAEESKVDIKPVIKSTPSTIVVGATKSKVETGVSFADMIKRQKQQAEPVFEVVPEPVVEVVPEPVVEVVPEPIVEAAPLKVEEPVVQAPVVEEPVVVAAPVAEVAPKPKKERKEPKKPKVIPLPQKYEAEIDRVASVNLPTVIESLATYAFTFSSEPGRAPSPPRQQPIQQQQQQQPIQHQQAHQQNDWNHQTRQQPTRWNQPDGNNYNNNRHNFSNDWRQNRYDNNNNMGYQNRMPNQQYRQQDNGYNTNVAMRAQPQANPQNFW